MLYIKCLYLKKTFLTFKIFFKINFEMRIFKYFSNSGRPCLLLTHGGSVVTIITTWDFSIEFIRPTYFYEDSFFNCSRTTERNMIDSLLNFSWLLPVFLFHSLYNKLVKTIYFNLRVYQILC